MTYSSSGAALAIVAHKVGLWGPPRRMSKAASPRGFWPLLCQNNGQLSTFFNKLTKTRHGAYQILLNDFADLAA